jgi:hypothetical protein
VSGTAYDSYNASLHLPEGLRIVGTEGTPSKVEDRRVVAGFPERRAPEQEEQIIVVAEVEKAFEHSEVGLSSLGTDSNTQNDRVAVKIRALAADPARQPATWRWDLVLGLVVALVLVTAFVVWRRKVVK